MTTHGAVVTVRSALPRPREVPRGVPVLALALTAPLLTAGAACGPIEYVNQVAARATSAVAAAKQVRADRHAPYEYTAAQEYLNKAREEAGQSAYQVSIEYGHKAEELAIKARAIAIEKSGGPDTRLRAPRKP